MELPQPRNFDYVLIWRIFLTLAVFSILSIIAYEEVKTTVTYLYKPTPKNRFIEKRQNNPADSPIVELGSDKTLLLNQPSTPFTVTLTDIFETLEVRVYYRSPKPEQLSISSDKSHSKPVIDPNKITLYDRLNQDPNWVWHPQKFSQNPDLTFYQKPGLPENFPSFEVFLREDTLDRIVQEAKVFVVKNDQNIEYQPLTHDFQLPYIAYLLVPNLDKVDTVEKLQQDSKGLYVQSLNEKLWEEIRVRGAKYNFRLSLDGYRNGDWATVEKIEIIAERKPVTFESLLNFIKRKLTLNPFAEA